MTLRSPAENEKMAIGGWISTAMTRNNLLPKQPSCPSRLRGERYFFEGVPSTEFRDLYLGDQLPNESGRGCART